MKPRDSFFNVMLDLEGEERRGDVIWRARRPSAAWQQGDEVRLTLPFQAQLGHSFHPNEVLPFKEYTLRVRAYGSEVVRLTLELLDELPGDNGAMLEWAPELEQVPLAVERTPRGWDVSDPAGNLRAFFDTRDAPVRRWADQVQPPPEAFACTVLPDGLVDVPFIPYDSFYPHHLESMSLGYTDHQGVAERALFSIHARHDERFAGTGERFAPLDLAGRTLLLENKDALGVNSRRAYKNVPFFLSSRGYGLILLTSAHLRLSLADVSTRAAQGMVEEPRLDLFFIGGGGGETPAEGILRTLRRISGFPRRPPLWSFGSWISRMTYYSAEETEEVAATLRKERFPCDVIHLDPGWFETPWRCDWRFSRERFAEPERFLARLRKQGYRVCLWNHPLVEPEVEQRAEAEENRYLAVRRGPAAAGKLEFAPQIDFSYPEATAWFQDLLRPALEQGAALIKADFGEEIDLDADYIGLPAALLHNLYALLYQRATWEITEEVTGEPVIWARAGWLGCQRYPVHWGGDAASSWDGLAGTIRGGLHLGLSGFGYWSHDVPGFHGLPDFMGSWPDADLYIRWTQVGVFSSHIRYHGASPREPYRFPEAATLVRRWLRLRYALLPYLWDQAGRIGRTGFPMLRALPLHHLDDRAAWQCDDQYYFGDALLVAPVLGPEGVRDVYLPDGRWIDIWSGEELEGPSLLRGVHSPLSRIPVYAVAGSRIRVYPERVLCTDEMDLHKARVLAFDRGYRGLASSLLGEVCGLE